MDENAWLMAFRLWRCLTLFYWDAHLYKYYLLNSVSFYTHWLRLFDFPPLVPIPVCTIWLEEKSASTGWFSHYLSCTNSHLLAASIRSHSLDSVNSCHLPPHALSSSSSQENSPKPLHSSKADPDLSSMRALPSCAAGRRSPQEAKPQGAPAMARVTTTCLHRMVCWHTKNKNKNKNESKE